MKKNLAEMHIFNVVTVLSRIARELRRLCAGSADRLAEIIDVIVLSGGRFEPAVAWAKALGAAEDEGPYGEVEHSADDGRIEWQDRYASCDCSLAGNKLDAAFNTCGGHGLRIIVTVPHYDRESDAQVDGDIEVIADDIVSTRFWADDEGDGIIDEQIVENRESAFLEALAVDDVEFSDNEEAKEAFEKRRAEKSVVFPSPETSRRVAAAKTAKAVIEANKKTRAAMSAVFVDDDEV